MERYTWERGDRSRGMVRSRCSPAFKDREDALADRDNCFPEDRRLRRHSRALRSAFLIALAISAAYLCRLDPISQRRLDRVDTPGSWKKTLESRERQKAKRMRPRQAAPYGPAPGSIPAGRRTVLLPPGGENESSPTYHMSSRLKHTLDNRPLLKMHYRGGNLGDQLFAWATLEAVADRNDMIPCVIYSFHDDDDQVMRTYFRGPFEECENAEVGYGWDPGQGVEFVDPEAFVRGPQDTSNVELYGTGRSYRNFEDSGGDRVAAAFTLKDMYTDIVEKTLSEAHFPTGIPIVGVHIRRNVEDSNGGDGEHPGVGYYDNAMRLMRRAHGGPDGSAIRFLIAADDLAWAREQPAFSTATDVYFVEDLAIATHTIWDGFESDDPSHASMVRNLAVLSWCDHMISGPGALSWWASWLGAHRRGGSVVYNDEGRRSRGEEAAYYPPAWVYISEDTDEAELISLNAARPEYDAIWIDFDEMKNKAILRMAHEVADEEEHMDDAKAPETS